MNVLAVPTNSGDPGPDVAAETAAIGELLQAGVIQRTLLKADYWRAVVLEGQGALCSASGDGIGGGAPTRNWSAGVRTLTGNAMRLNEHPNLASERYEVAECNSWR